MHFSSVNKFYCVQPSSDNLMTLSLTYFIKLPVEYYIFFMFNATIIRCYTVIPIMSNKIKPKKQHLANTSQTTQLAKHNFQSFHKNGLIIICCNYCKYQYGLFNSKYTYTSHKS